MNHCKNFTSKIIKKFKLNLNKGEIIEISFKPLSLFENFKKKFKCIGRTI